MPTKLVIVESPAKARTIQGYLGRGFVVESSLGHVRDLPQDAADIPEKYKGEDWARLGVDVHHGFKPLYVESEVAQGADHQAAPSGQGGRGALPGHGRGPRGRIHRLAPARSAQAAGPGAPPGVPRDHPPGHPGRPRRAARGGPVAGGGPGDAAHPRPPVRLPGLRGAVAEDQPRPVGGPGAEPGGAHRGGARARAHGLSLGRLLGRRRHLRHPHRRRRALRRHAGGPGRPARGLREGLRPLRPGPQRRRGGPRPGRRRSRGGRSRGSRLPRCARWSTAPIAAPPTPRSARRPCSRKPAASCASPPIAP